MQNTSELYKEILAGNHHKEVKLEVFDSEGVQAVGTFGMDKLTSMETTKSAFSGDTPTIGSCVSGKIVVSFYPTDSNGNTINIPRMATLKPFVRLVQDDGTASEWLQKGQFFVDTRSTNEANGVITLEGYDAMLKAEADFPTVEQAEYPAEDTTVLAEISSFLGVPVDERTYSVIRDTYTVPNPIAYSCREVLSGIAASYGCNFVVSDEGKLLAMPVETPLSDSVAVVDRSAKSIVSANALSAVTKVILNIDEENYVESGTDTGRTIEASCPWATTQMANNVLQLLSDWEYVPFLATNVTIDPAFEVGDGATVDGKNCIIFRQEINHDSLFASNIEAPNESETDHEYTYTPKENRAYKRTLAKTRSEITQNAEQIALKVSSDEARTLIDQTVDSISLSVGGTGGTTKFELKRGSTIIDSDTVDLKVKSANISGTITVGQLSSDVAQKSDIPTKTSELTNDSDFQNATQVTTITNDTIQTTNVVAQNLQVNAANIDGYISANSVRGGMFIVTDDTGEVYGEKCVIRFAKDNKVVGDIKGGRLCIYRYPHSNPWVQIVDDIDDGLGTYVEQDGIKISTLKKGATYDRYHWFLNSTIASLKSNGLYGDETTPSGDVFAELYLNNNDPESSGRILLSGRDGSIECRDLKPKNALGIGYGGTGATTRGASAKNLFSAEDYSGNVNNITETGCYWLTNDSSGKPSGVNYGYLLHANSYPTTDDLRSMQVLVAHTGSAPRLYVRHYTNNQWYAWSRCLSDTDKETETLDKNYLNMNCARHGTVKFIRCSTTPNAAMSSGQTYPVGTLSEAFRPTYYISHNVIGTSGAVQGTLTITTAGLVQFTARANLATSTTININLTYI